MVIFIFLQSLRMSKCFQYTHVNGQTPSRDLSYSWCFRWRISLLVASFNRFLSFFFFFEIQELYIILIPKGEGECRQFKGEKMMFKKDKWALRRIDERYGHCLCSVAKSCPVLCDPMDCSINRFLNVAYLLRNVLK